MACPLASGSCALWTSSANDAMRTRPVRWVTLVSMVAAANRLCFAHRTDDVSCAIHKA